MATIVESAIELRRDPAPFVKSPHHVAGLDGLRARAILAVMGRWIWIDTGETHLDRRVLGILLGCAVALSLRQGGWPRLRIRLDSSPFRISILVAIAACIVVGTYFNARGYS